MVKAGRLVTGESQCTDRVFPTARTELPQRPFISSGKSVVADAECAANPSGISANGTEGLEKRHVKFVTNIVVPSSGGLTIGT